jgi:hypothetical protein
LSKVEISLRGEEVEIEEEYGKERTMELCCRIFLCIREGEVHAVVKGSAEVVRAIKKG